MARSGLQSLPLRNALFALFIGGILAYGATFAWYLLDRFDLVNLIRDVNYDDAFYYFQIAFHMADGKFSTFDGGLTRTNGYHPLWLFLITPFYWVFDKTETLFAIKAFEILLVAGGVALVAGAARVARLPWILLFAALPALYQRKALFMGMEAAAALFLLGLFLLTICLSARDPAKWRWPLTAVAFALPWVRLEYVAIALAATAALWLLEWSWRARPPRVPVSEWARSMFSARAGSPFLAAGASLLVYFAYNAVVFGGIVPVSAATKQWMSQHQWEREGGYSLTENIREFLRTGVFDDELLIAFEVCAYVVLVWWVARRSRSREAWLLLAFLVGMFGLAAGHLAKFVQSVLTVNIWQGKWGWYFVPAYLMEALVVPVRCYVAIYVVRRFIGLAPLHASRIPSLGVVTIGAVILAATTDFTAPFRFVDWHSEVTYREWRVSSYMGTLVMDRVLPEDSIVGSWDSGATGYFSRFPVVNLDGSVNSYDYLHVRREGAPAAFRQRYGITHLANVRELAYHNPTLFEGPWFHEKTEKRQFKLWPEKWRWTSWCGVNRSAWFWERMEPHLERQADGTGLLVDGRLAQAFVRDCTPDELAVWTWANQGGPVPTPWTRMSIGFCTSAIVLPHDALLPVRVVTMPTGEYLADRVGDRRPGIHSDFDVYLVENVLIYVKNPCGQEDVDAPFFLHLDAVVSDDLPRHRKWYGFDNLDFRFHKHGDGPGTMVGGTCLVEVPLPDYGIATIRTGQFVAVGDVLRHLWEGEIHLG